MRYSPDSHQCNRKGGTVMTQMADAVVIGSGAFGGSVAFHLLQRGVRNVIVIDQHEIGSQTSARAAGNAAQARGHHLMTTIARDAVERFMRFTDETGERLEVIQSGSLALSWTERGASMLSSLDTVAHKAGLETALITASEARDLSPFLDADSATAILHTPSDLYLEPAQLPLAYASAIRKQGATLIPRTKVTGILRDGDDLRGVEIEQGEILTPIVVDAAGGWAREVAEQAGVRIPLVPVRHQLLVTDPLAGLAPDHPIVRFSDINAYCRPSLGGLLLGAYEQDPLVVDPAERGRDFVVDDLSFDRTMLERVAAKLSDRFALLRDLPSRVREVRGGLPTMTPDGFPLLGPVPGIGGMYAIAGCCVGGFSIAPSLGSLLADLIVDGRVPLDLTPLALDRFGDDWTEDWLVTSCLREYSLVYDMRDDVRSDGAIGDQ
jgi:glycine/D-amino acid oxidase-like deaminating enzyme